MANLTKRTIDLLSPGPKVSCVWDEKLKGFGLRIMPSGRKTFVVKCMVKGRQKFITIGPHGPITAEQARARASGRGQERRRTNARTRRSAAIPDYEESRRESAQGACVDPMQAEHPGGVQARRGAFYQSGPLAPARWSRCSVKTLRSSTIH